MLQLSVYRFIGGLQQESVMLRLQSSISHYVRNCAQTSILDCCNRQKRFHPGYLSRTATLERNFGFGGSGALYEPLPKPKLGSSSTVLPCQPLPGF